MATKRTSIDHRLQDRSPTPPPAYESSLVAQWPLSSIAKTPYMLAGTRKGVVVQQMSDLEIYDVHDGSNVASTDFSANGELTSVSVSGCGSYVFTGGSDGKVRKWNVGALSLDCICVSERLGTDWIESLSVSPGVSASGKIVIGVLTRDNCVYMLDGDRLEVAASRKAPNLHKNGVECFAISSSGNNVVTSAARAKAKSQAFKLWTGQMEEVVKLKQPHMNAVQGVVFGPTSDDKFYSFANDCAIKIWSFKNKVCTSTIESAHHASISNMSFSSDGGYFLTTAMDNSLTMWNVSTNKRRASCDAGEILSQAVFCGSEDERVVTLSRAGGVMVWEESNPDRRLVDNSVIQEAVESTTTQEPPVPLSQPPHATGVPPAAQPAEPSPRMSFNILNKMTSAFRSSSKSFDSSVTNSPVTPASSPQGISSATHRRSANRGSLTGAVAMPGMGAIPIDNYNLDRDSASTIEDPSLKLEVAQNQVYYTKTKNAKLEKEVEGLKAKLYAKDVELQKKQEELDAAVLQSQQTGRQWRTYHDHALNDTASRWRTHSESLEAEKQNEADANSSIREEIEHLKEEYNIFKQKKDAALDARIDEVERLKELLKEQEADNDKRGFMDQIIFNILKGTKCMDVQYSLKQDEGRMTSLSKLVADAMNNDYLPATQLMDAARRHKNWEAEGRKKLSEDIRAIVLDKEIEFAYKRHETIRSIESLRDRTLNQCRELASKMRSDVTNAEIYKKRYHELVEEHDFVEKKVVEGEERLNSERERLGEISVSGNATLVREAQSNIQDNLQDVAKWVDVKKDIYYTMKKEENLYFRALESRDNSRANYESRQMIYDEGIGQAFVSAIKIVSDADEVAAAEEYKKQLKLEKEQEEKNKIKREKERREKRKKAIEAKEVAGTINQEAGTRKRSNKKSPFLMGTHATMNRIRERMQGKYDVSFGDLVSKDSKFNRGDIAFKRTRETEKAGLHEPPLSRALFAESARKNQTSERNTVLERHM